MANKKVKVPTCPYCNNQSELTKYNRRYVWACTDCDARVGTHTQETPFYPLGTLADADLRVWRANAHRCFDPLWKAKRSKTNCSKSKARQLGYRWLAKELGIKLKLCHIALFDIDQCRQVVALCRPYLLKVKNTGLDYE